MLTRRSLLQLALAGFAAALVPWRKKRGWKFAGPAKTLTRCGRPGLVEIGPPLPPGGPWSLAAYSHRLYAVDGTQAFVLDSRRGQWKPWTPLIGTSNIYEAEGARLDWSWDEGVSRAQLYEQYAKEREAHA